LNIHFALYYSEQEGAEIEERVRLFRRKIAKQQFYLHLSTAKTTFAELAQKVRICTEVQAKAERKIKKANLKFNSRRSVSIKEKKLFDKVKQFEGVKFSIADLTRDKVTLEEEHLQLDAKMREILRNKKLYQEVFYDQEKTESILHEAMALVEQARAIIRALKDDQN